MEPVSRNCSNDWYAALGPRPQWSSCNRHCKCPNRLNSQFIFDFTVPILTHLIYHLCPSPDYRPLHSYTKASVVAAIIFVLDKKTELISAPHALVYFGIVIFLVYFKLSSILLGIHDPFVPFENLFCALFLGGIWDSLAKLLGKGQAKEESKDARKTNWFLFILDHRTHLNPSSLQNIICSKETITSETSQKFSFLFFWTFVPEDRCCSAKVFFSFLFSLVVFSFMNWQNLCQKRTNFNETV